jgi:NADPH:quinone reductase-like Zn-dependent oxidoreductase
VRDGGTFASTLLGSADQLPSDTVTVTPIYAKPTAEMLNRLAAAQADGSTTVTVQQTYPLEQAATALADFGNGTLGKLVIEIG